MLYNPPGAGRPGSPPAKQFLLRKVEGSCCPNHRPEACATKPLVSAVAQASRL